MKHFSLPVAFISLFVMLLASCGGSSEASAVQYEGTTLIVDGVRYERSADVQNCPSSPELLVCSPRYGSYAVGEISIYFHTEQGKDRRVEEEMGRLGLTVKSKHSWNAVSASGWVISVPPLFEEQWVTALTGNPLFDMGVVVNTVAYTTH